MQSTDFWRYAQPLWLTQIFERINMLFEWANGHNQLILNLLVEKTIENMDRRKKRRNMLQWGILMMFTGMVMLSALPTIHENLWKGFTALLGATFIIFGIFELVKYYKLGKINRD